MVTLTSEPNVCENDTSDDMKTSERVEAFISSQ